MDCAAAAWNANGIERNCLSKETEHLTEILDTKTAKVERVARGGVEGLQVVPFPLALMP